MCIIIYKPEDKKFSETLMRRAFAGNDDGFGLMYVCGDKNCKKVHHAKTVAGIDQILKMYKPVQHRELAMHFRFATHGTISQANAHPYPVYTIDKDGFDLYMMHNGVFNFVDTGKDKDKSDTAHFIDNWLKPVLNGDPAVLQNKMFQKMLGRAIDGNKLLFLDGDGNYTFINEHLGDIHKDSGCWVSQQYSLYPTSYYSFGKKWNNRWDEQAWGEQITWTAEDEADYQARRAAQGLSNTSDGVKVTDKRAVSLPFVAATPSTTTTAKSILTLPAHTETGVKNAAESASVILALQAAAIVNEESGEDDPAESDIELEVETIRERFRTELASRHLEEEDFQDLEWFKVYELVCNHPEKVADFLYGKFA